MNSRFEKPIVPQAPGEKVELLDSKYGDSDVYIVESAEVRFVRKVYQPARMLANLNRVLNSKLPSYHIIETYLPELVRIDAKQLAMFYLEPMLRQYQSDTLAVANDVTNNPDIYTQKIKGNSGIKTIEFEIIKQGEKLYRLDKQNLNSPLVTDGQELVTGKNLEQIIGVPGIPPRNTINNAEQSLPKAFSKQEFVDEILLVFNKRFASRFLARQKNFIPPIFHRIHPANVIPEKVEDGHWKFRVTDISTILCLDYSMVLGEQMRQNSF